MIDLKTTSPNAIYTDHCKRGELAYQVDLDTGRAIFFPHKTANRKNECGNQEIRNF